MKAAIFDMDGTLVDSLMLWDLLWTGLGEKYRHDPAFRPSEEDDKAVRTLTLPAAMELIHSRYQLGESGEELLHIATEAMVDFYAHRVKAKPGVEEFLECCRAHGVRMCIASATAPELVQLALEHCGIAGYFETVFSCGTLGVGKDKPDVFLLAQKHLGAPLEETWVFEDSLVAMENAVKAGLPVVGIYDRYNFGQEQIKAIASLYVGPGESMEKLLKEPVLFP